MAVNYNPNVALIQGAAAIGRSTLPADLSGAAAEFSGERASGGTPQGLEPAQPQLRTSLDEMFLTEITFSVFAG